MRSLTCNHRSSILSMIVLLVVAAVASWGVSATAGGATSISSPLPALQASPPQPFTLQSSSSNGQTNCKYTCIALAPIIKVTHSGVATCASDDKAWCEKIIDQYCNSFMSTSRIECKVVSKATLSE